MDAAYLNMVADSSQIPHASGDLERLYQSAIRAETGVENLGASTARVNGLFGRMGGSIRSAGGYIQVLANRSGGAIGGLRGLGLQLNQVAQVGAMTGKWMEALAVQLPDILIGFGTLGIFAGIAAAALIPLAQNFAGASKNAESLTDRIDEAGEALKRYRDHAEMARSSTDDLIGRFGAASEEAQRMYRRMAENDLMRMSQSINGLMRDQMDPMNLDNTLKGLQSGKVSNFFGVERPPLGITLTDEQREMERMADAMSQRLIDASNSMNSARGIEEQTAAVEDMLNAYTRLADYDGERTEQERDYIDALSETLSKMYEMQAVSADLASTDPNKEKMEDIRERMNEAAQNYIKQQEALEAQRLELTQNLELQRAIAEHGRESKEVEELRIEQERANLRIQLEKDGYLKAQINQLLEIFDLTQDINEEQRIQGVVTENTKRQEEIIQLTRDREDAVTALNKAAEEGDLAGVQRAEEAIDNIDAQIEKTTEAEGRVESLSDTVERLQRALKMVEVDGEGEITEALSSWDQKLEDARDRVGELNNADLTTLETGLRNLVRWMDSLLLGTGETIDSLQEGLTTQEVYGVYQRSRVAGNRIGMNNAASEGILSLIREVEGTSEGASEGYNETLGRGAYTGGSVDLVNMTLREVRELQRQMLNHPDNKFNSSALGAYQVVGSTMFGSEFLGNESKGEGLRKQLGLGWDDRLTPEIQDRMAMELIRQTQARGGSTQDWHNQWQGFETHGVDARTINRAMQTTDLPTIDPEVEKDNERAQREADREAERAERLAERQREEYDRLTGSVNPLTAALLEYREAQETVNEALKQGYITAEEADATLKQAKQQMIDSVAAYQEQLRDSDEAYQRTMDHVNSLSSALARAAIYGEDLGEAMTNTFRQIAMSYMQNQIADLLSFGMDSGGGGGNILSQLGNIAISAIGGGGGGGGGGVRIPPELQSYISRDGGGYTFDGPRVGGVDGRGGRWGLYHPNETVIDHTKGQGAGGGTMVQVNLSGIEGHTVKSQKTSQNGSRVDIELERAVGSMIDSGRLDKPMKRRFGSNSRPQGGTR